MGVDRARPALHEVLTTLPVDPAFPSAHSAQAMAMALGLMLLLPSQMQHLGWLLVVLAVLVGISRLYLQVLAQRRAGRLVDRCLLCAADALATY